MSKQKVKCPLSNALYEAFAFFVLAIEQKLYDLTDDTAKAPALNTYTRTMELQSVAQANYVAGIGKDALKPFLEEMEWSISRDPALNIEERALCRAQIESVSLRAGESAQVSRAVAGLRIVLRNYFSSIQREIKQVVATDQNRKGDLEELAGNFIIQAELRGFPRRLTYHLVQSILVKKLRGTSDFEPIKVLEDFFQAFQSNKRFFDCVFLLDRKAARNTKLLEKFGLKTSDSPPDWNDLTPRQAQFLASRKTEQTWLIAENIEASNSAAAHEEVAARFNAISAVLSFFDHQGHDGISRISLARDRHSGQAFTFHEAPDPMLCWVGSMVSVQSDHIDLSDAIYGGHLSRDSAVRLNRTLRFHRAALISNSPENQLIDLWAALEGLLPTPKKETLRIEYFAESILPALTLSYPEKLFGVAFRDVERDVEDLDSVLSEVSFSGSRFAKFIALILCAECSQERSNLIARLERNPLIRNRLWRLSQLFKSRKAIQNTLREHRRKVKWHLNRIYFTRNSLMHSASSLPYLRTLVENLHFYVDTLVRVVYRIAHRSPEQLSIEAALQYLAAWERVRLATENVDNSAPPTLENVWELVFGRDLILAPEVANEL